MNINAETIETILNSKEPRVTGKQVANELKLDFGFVWQKVLLKAETVAKETISISRLKNCMSDISLMYQLMEEVNQDRTLVKLNYLISLLENIQLSPEEYDQLLHVLPKSREFDSTFETLIISNHASVDTLLKFIGENRFITAIAHRTGPEEVLRAVTKVYPFDEPVRTLIERWYMSPNYPVEKLVTFVNEHKPRFGEYILKTVQSNKSLPKDRVKLVVGLIEGN